MNKTTILNYLSYCQSHKRLSAHTIRAYKNDLFQFLNSGYEDVKEYINVLNKTTKRTSTLKRKIASLKAFYKYLQEESIISLNPFSQLRFHFRKEKTLPKIIPINDLEMIYCYLQDNFKVADTEYQKEKRHRNFLIISLLLSTGIRVSELCHISLEQFDADNRTIHILGKGKKERIIYLGDDSTYQLLTSYVNNYRSNKKGYLFLGKDNKRPLTEQSIRLILNNITKVLNLEKQLTPHMFRHSFATMLLDNNVDTRHIQHILGHSSIAITQIYTHVSQVKQQTILTENNPINLVRQR